MLNQIHLIGRLGKEAETTATYTRFSLATSERWQDKTSGEWQERTEWHRVIRWGDPRPMPKGALVAVTGKVTYTEHNGKWYTDIVATKVMWLDRPRTEQRQGAPADAMQPPLGPAIPGAGAVVHIQSGGNTLATLPPGAEERRHVQVSPDAPPPPWTATPPPAGGQASASDDDLPF